jgi:hypothetical protein
MKPGKKHEEILVMLNERMRATPDCKGVTIPTFPFWGEEIVYSGSPPLSGPERCDRAARRILQELLEEYDVQ